MIAVDGHITLLEGFHVWRRAVEAFIKAERNSVSEAAISILFEPFMEDAFGLFCDELSEPTVPAYIRTDAGSVVRISAEVFRSQDADEFIDYFLGVGLSAEWSEESDSYHFYNRSEFESEFGVYSLPGKNGRFFLYIDPVSSVIDCSGFRFANEQIMHRYDREEHEAMQYLFDIAPDVPVRDILKDAQHYVRLETYRELLDCGVPKHLLGRSSPMERYEGCSITLKRSELLEFLETEYSIETPEPPQTIAKEVAAEKRAREFFEKNPVANLRKEDFFPMFCSEIGSRAKLRVWAKLALDYPQLSKGGRKPKRRTGTPK